MALCLFITQMVDVCCENVLTHLLQSRKVFKQGRSWSDAYTQELRMNLKEVFHEKAFRMMAGDAAMQKTQYTHELGLELLGLSE